MSDQPAPFRSHIATVRPEWIDHNGHMNVGYYAVAFDQGADAFTDQLGIGTSHAQGLGMIFALETHATFEREMLLGAAFDIATQIIDHDAKRLHLFSTMLRQADGAVAATTEVMLSWIDASTRRSAPWPPAVAARIAAMAAAHAHLPRPDQLGRRVGIRRPV